MENKVKEIRIKSKLTQVELSKKAGVSRSIIASLISIHAPARGATAS